MPCIKRERNIDPTYISAHRDIFVNKYKNTKSLTVSIAVGAAPVFGLFLSRHFLMAITYILALFPTCGIY